MFYFFAKSPTASAELPAVGFMTPERIAESGSSSAAFYPTESSTAAVRPMPPSSVIFDPSPAPPPTIDAMLLSVETGRL